MKRKFIKVECQSCGYRQVVFTKPSMKVSCNSCGALIAEPSGGIGDFKGRIVK